MAQSDGWEASRAGCRAATWWRHLELLGAAGVRVPFPAGLDSRIVEHPTRPRPATLGDCRRILGLRFRIVEPWRHIVWPAGTVGTVHGLLFRDGRWLYELEIEEVLDTLAVGDFYRCCTLLGGTPDAD